MEKCPVHKFYRFSVVLLSWVFLAGLASADPITLHPKNAEPVSGEVIDTGETGVRLKLSDDTYLPKPIPWGLLSQDDLKALQVQFAQNQKVLNYIEPFIAIPIAEKLSRTDIGTTNAVPRLDRPEVHSVFSALGSSAGGMLMLLLLYAGNLYAAYEIAVFRAQPPGLVCGLAAVVPVLGPIIFLALPRREPRSVSDVYEVPDENLEAAIASEQAAPVEAPATRAVGAPRHPATQSVAAAAGAPAAKIFARGQFTFNRRFFETQMPGFFAVVRPNADKDTLLIFKAARGNFTVERISRITPNEVYVTVRKGHASEEVIIPFNEIQEVQLVPKHA